MNHNTILSPCSLNQGNFSQLSYREVLIREESRVEKRYDLAFGFLPVQLPDMPIGLSLVVVSGFGPEPMILLTNLPTGAGLDLDDLRTCEY